MPSIIDSQFQSFISQIGLRKEVAALLWEADIHTPQELAAMEQEDLMKITSNPLLVKNIHPILQKYLYNISMAKDPYKKAMAIMKKHAQMDDDDDEPMETQAGLTADSTSSDALPWTNDTDSLGGRTAEPVDQRNSSACATTRAAGPTVFNNNHVRMQSRGNGGNVQSNIGVSKGKPAAAQNGASITISGGNFVQSNIMGQGAVTYNNTNTVISTSMGQNEDQDKRERREKKLNTQFMLNGHLVNTRDISWSDGEEFWVENLAVSPVGDEEYFRHLQSDDVYAVRNPGFHQALILNNIEFQRGSKMSPRVGADADGQHFSDLMLKLGFQVRHENNKTADEMREILRSFAKDRKNIKADMTVVYIGSHGERDSQGNDTFVGTDGGRVQFNEVKQFFSPQECPAMIEKPKLFFLQFCRQDMKTDIPPPAAVFQTASVHGDSINADSMPYETEPVVPVTPKQEKRLMDLMCVYATLAGTKAYRDTADGSWFVTALVRIFKDHAHKEDVLSMITKVNNHVSLKTGMEGGVAALQVSEVVHNLRKKIYFFPGQNK